MNTNKEFALKTKNRNCDSSQFLCLGLKLGQIDTTITKRCISVFVFSLFYMYASTYAQVVLGDICYRCIDLSLSLSLFGLSDVCPVLQI